MHEIQVEGDIFNVKVPLENIDNFCKVMISDSLEPLEEHNKDVG